MTTESQQQSEHAAAAVDPYETRTVSYLRDGLPVMTGPESGGIFTIRPDVWQDVPFMRDYFELGARVAQTFVAESRKARADV